MANSASKTEGIGYTGKDPACAGISQAAKHTENLVLCAHCSVGDPLIYFKKFQVRLGVTNAEFCTCEGVMAVSGEREESCMPMSAKAGTVLARS